MNKATTVFLVSILIALAVAGAAFGGGSSLARVTVTAAGIEFEPEVEAASYLLTLSGPQGFLYREERAGAPPRFSVWEHDLADGLYRWELRAYPAPRALVEDRDTTWRDRSEVQSGAFTVREGALVDPAAGENADKDVVHLDDVIVDGSLCVGLDCVNGENFGFDTLRLKENNLRIKFQDTSSSNSFPSNDWQLTINDSANGGANKFSIDDVDGGRTPFTIEAGAPSNSLYVDDGGRVGLGTNVPVLDLHVVGGNTPALRLEQNGSSGFTPQTWDVAGNETNFFIRDLTNGSKLPFRIRPNAPTSSIDVAGNGHVGIGTATPQGKLHVATTTGNDVVVLQDGRVGIGTLSPEAAVHVRSSQPDALVLEGSMGKYRLRTDDLDGTFQLWQADDPAGGPSVTVRGSRDPVDPANPLQTQPTVEVHGSVRAAGSIFPSTSGTWELGPTGAGFRIRRAGTAGAEFNLAPDGTLTMGTGGAARFTLDPGGNIFITGEITTTGSCKKGCDTLFRNEVESIAEHAAFMWSNSYLPGVGPTPEDEPMNLSEKTGGLLNELEKAHVYIEQLHGRLEALQARVEALEETPQEKGRQR